MTGATIKAGGAKPPARSREDKNMITMIRLTAAVAGLAVTLASTAWAQQPPTMRVRGQIEKADGSVLAKNMYVGRGVTPAM